MRLLSTTLDSPAENVALDEALLEAAEAGEEGECLRLWESPVPMVVIGRSSRMREEVDLDACARRGAAALRRVSGGASIVSGPGCLMYAVTLSIRERPELKAIDNAHGYVLGRVAAGVAAAGARVTRQGTSDLVLQTKDDQPARKVSGNSLRVKRDWLLYHGTLLYDFDLPLIAELLRTPPRQPDYRQRRGHLEFVANLPVTADALRQGLAEAWGAAPAGDGYPEPRVDALARERYARDEWNLMR